MKLSEAFNFLGLGDPLAFEQLIYDTSPFRQSMDRMNIGSTTHLIIEACLDVRELGVEDPEIWFLRGDKKSIRIAQDVVGRLGCEGKIGYNFFDIPVATPICSSYYLDHRLLDPRYRLTGPFRLVRLIRREGDSYHLYTRDGDFISTTNRDGVDIIRTFSGCGLNDHGLLKNISTGTSGGTGSQAVIDSQAGVPAPGS